MSARPHADLFNVRGRAWLARQPVPDDEGSRSSGMCANSIGLPRDLATLDREIAETTLDDPAIRRLLTTGVNLAVAAGLMAAIGDIARFKSPQKLVSYFGLAPRVHQSGLVTARHGRMKALVDLKDERSLSFLTRVGPLTAESWMR
ncbi:transposase [Mesorhizobium sp.]|uniref:transposase n=1 Tax=Mesorhizobium sp. TaxID=1871066 RepID=UPI0025795B5C|nr:transposase [Mesorhizobium sp.]